MSKPTESFRVLSLVYRALQNSKHVSINDVVFDGDDESGGEVIITIDNGPNADPQLQDFIIRSKDITEIDREYGGEE